MKRASYLLSITSDGDCEEPTKSMGQRFRFQSCSSTNSSSSTTVISPPPTPLPRDLIINEILTRVSLEHLICRCRFVCKDWRRLTYNSDFKLMHSQKTPTISGYLIRMLSSVDGQTPFKFVSINHNEVDHSETVPISLPPPPPPNYLDFLPLTPELQDFDILSSSSPHGIFFCHVVSFEPKHGRVSSRSSYVCKPATREWQKIPDPPRDPKYFSTLKVAILVVKQQEQRQQIHELRVNPLHYKIIRLGMSSYGKLGGKYAHYLECDVFDSKDWEWKMSPRKMTELPNCFVREKPLMDPGILVHGAVYWLSHSEGEICAFEINKPGPWKVIPMPSDEQLRNEMHEYYESGNGGNNHCSHEIRLVEYEGQLGLVYLGFRKRLTLELWVLKDYNYYIPQLNKAIIWNKFYLIDLGPGYGEISRYDLNCMVLQLYTKDIILMQIEDEVIWYNLQTGTRSIAFKIPAGYWIQKVHPIHSDLLPCNF